MNTRYPPALRHVIVMAAVASLAATTSTRAGTVQQERNRATVQAAFDAWRAGTGGPFALLADDASWIITRHSQAAGTYRSRDAFIDAVITPFNARLTKPLVPTRRSLHATATQ